MWPTLATHHWSTVLNVLIQKYLINCTTVCILWHEDILLQLDPKLNLPIVSISKTNLAASFQQDIYNFSLRRQTVRQHELIQKLTVSIERSHCEGFIAFQDDIPHFSKSFRNASTFSIWRSYNNKFIFVYRLDLMMQNYFNDWLFQDQPNILVIEAENANSTIFNIKTNKFIGSVHKNPKHLYLLDRFNAVERTFDRNQELTPNKVANLMGREIVLGAFDYRPFAVVDYEYQPQIYDWAVDNPNHSIHIDGTEIRFPLTFCEFHNCTVQFDSSEKSNWGILFDNYTGTGLMGMVGSRKADMVMDAMYNWYNQYYYIDMTVFIGRSGVTCIVPAPSRLISWMLPLAPFQLTLWLGFFVCMFLEFLGLMVTHHMEQTFEQTNNAWLLSIEFGYKSALKLFISQSTNYIVNSISVRMVLFSCYMIDIIITSIYSGGLSSILTQPTLGEAADSTERLSKYNLIWIGSSPVWIYSIENADDPTLKNLVKNFRIYSKAEMRELAKTENMGFVLERMIYGHFGNGEFITEESLARMKMMIDDMYYAYSVIYVPRIWGLLEQFNSFIYNWHSSGFNRIWEWKITADYLNVNVQNRVIASKETNYDTGAVKLGMQNFAGLLLIWLVGTTLSIFVFFIELWSFYRKHKNTRHLSAC